MYTRKLLAVAAVALLAACTSQKEPAEQTTASIEAGLNEIRADAQQYAAEQLQAADASVNRLKEHLARQDYSAVMQMAPAIRAELAALRTTVTEASTPIKPHATRFVRFAIQRYPLLYCSTGEQAGPMEFSPLRAVADRTRGASGCNDCSEHPSGWRL